MKTLLLVKIGMLAMIFATNSAHSQTATQMQAERQAELQAEAQADAQAERETTPLLEQANAQIAAHANLIRDAINEAVRKIEDQPLSEDFDIEDYLRQLPAFTDKISKALDQFAAKVGDEDTGILAELKPEMKAYNRVILSKRLSAEAKEIKIREWNSKIESKVKLVTAKYQRAVGEAIDAALGNLPIEARFYGGYKEALFSSSHLLFEAEHKNLVDTFNGGRDWRYINIYNTDFSVIRSSEFKFWHGKDERKAKRVGAKDAKMLFDEYFYPIISEGCEYHACLALRAGDIFKSFEVLRKNLYVDIPFHLADKTSFVIKGRNESRDETWRWINTLEWTRAMLFRSDYPVDPRIKD